MPRKKTPAQKLASGSKLNKKPESPLKSFIQLLAHHPDLQESANLVEDYSIQDWQSRDDHDYYKEKLKKDALKGQYDRSTETLTRLQTERDQSDSFVEQDDPKSRKPFWEWDPIDMVSITLTNIFMSLSMFMGAANVYAILMATGEDVFLDNPVLAACIAAIMPSASFALKCYASLIEIDRTRKRLINYLLASLAVVITLWIGLFAYTFEGVSSFSFDPVETGGWTTGLQLLGEFLISTSLGVYATKIAARYQTPHIATSVRHQARSQAVMDFLPEHEALEARYAEACARVERLEADRAKHVSEQLALFYDLHRRHQMLD